MIVAVLIAAAFTALAAQHSKDKTEISQEIKVKGQKSSGPKISLPAPHADKEIIDEVIRSLDVYQGEHKARPGQAVSAGAKRLSRPFPEPPYLVFSPQAIKAPYDRWVFEVVSGSEIVWRLEGAGKIKENIEWDGSGLSGETAVRVGRPFHFRFTGKSTDKEFAITSQNVTLQSLSYREYVGETLLEVASSVLFAPGKAAFAAGAEEYLAYAGDRLRRADIHGTPYKFLLYEPEPKGRLALSRAENLKDHFSKYLLIHPNRVEVAILRAGARGEVAVCVLPAEKGARIPTE